ncbi:lasso peptide biosynthesis B2 protein [Streptomyces sp. NPDC057638]|uniref:lasso peptide biosynthesis B2 protein n=1 Tax=Streptomyces sp. NPDC057638 TaxID=3346190 RepID=UPI0036CC9B31
MSTPILPTELVTISPARRLLTHTAIGTARVLATRSPARIRTVLARLGRGVRPATYAETSRAHNTVLQVSPRCCGTNACLVRSIATVLLCRAEGSWPTWCVGVILAPPFAAHAWVEAEGRLVNEPVDRTRYGRLITVGTD